MPIKNFDVKITNFDGKNVIDPTGKEITAREFIQDALRTPIQGIIDNAEQHWKKFCLGLKLQKGGEQNYTVDELTFMKELIVKFGLSSVVIGRIYEIINDDAKKIDEKE